jgi:hypothetical protein
MRADGSPDRASKVDSANLASTLRRRAVAILPHGVYPRFPRGRHPLCRAASMLGASGWLTRSRIRCGFGQLSHPPSAVVPSPPCLTVCIRVFSEAHHPPCPRRVDARCERMARQIAHQVWIPPTLHPPSAAVPSPPCLTVCIRVFRKAPYPLCPRGSRTMAPPDARLFRGLSFGWMPRVRHPSDRSPRCVDARCGRMAHQIAHQVWIRPTSHPPSAAVPSQPCLTVCIRVSERRRIRFVRAGAGRWIHLMRVFSAVCPSDGCRGCGTLRIDHPAAWMLDAGGWLARSRIRMCGLPGSSRRGEHPATAILLKKILTSPCRASVPRSFPMASETCAPTLGRRARGAPYPVIHRASAPAE